MSSVVKVLLAGLLISLLGALPFGVLNITAFRISNAYGIQAAFIFTSGVVLVELAYLRLTLFGSQWLSKQPWLDKLPWLGVLIFTAMTLHSCWNIFSPAENLNEVLYADHFFLEGVLLSAINPLQIPFWLAWNTVLTSKRILLTDRLHYNYYLVGAGLGTTAGLGVFIASGWLLSGNSMDQTWVNIGIAALYTGCLIFQVTRLCKMKPVVQIHEPVSKPDRISN